MTAPARPIVLGLVGPGRWGRNYIRTIEALPRPVLAATATRDWRSMIERAGLDGLVIATPPATHAKIALAAIEAGLPVLIEKPLTLSLAEAWALLDGAERCAGRAMVDHTHLFQPAWVELKRRAAAMGPVRSIRARAGDYGPFRDDCPVLWDWGPHDVALCLDLVGEKPRSAAARRLKSEKTGDGDGEVIGITLDFHGGPTAEIEIGNIVSPERRFEADCGSGTLIMNTLAAPALSIAPRGKAARVAQVGRTPPLTVAVERFLDMIEKPGPDLSSLRLAVEVIEVLETCQRTLDP